MLPDHDAKPRTTWACCLTWSDALTHWSFTAPASLPGFRHQPRKHRRAVIDGASCPVSDRGLVVVTVAAALYQHARDVGLDGEAVGQVPLTDPGDTSVLGTVHSPRVRCAVRDCPAVAEELAEGERAAVLVLAATRSRTPPRRRWHRVHELAREVVGCHAHAALLARVAPELPYPRVVWQVTVPLADRRPALTSEHHRRPTAALAAVVGGQP